MNEEFKKDFGIPTPKIVDVDLEKDECPWGFGWFEIKADGTKGKQLKNNYDTSD